MFANNRTNKIGRNDAVLLKILDGSSNPQEQILKKKGNVKKTINTHLVFLLWASLKDIGLY